MSGELLILKTALMVWLKTWSQQMLVLSSWVTLQISVKDTIRRTGKISEVLPGETLIGRVVDPLGRPALMVLEKSTLTKLVQ